MFVVLASGRCALRCPLRGGCRALHLQSCPPRQTSERCCLRGLCLSCHGCTGCQPATCIALVSALLPMRLLLPWPSLICQRKVFLVHQAECLPGLGPGQWDRHGTLPLLASLRVLRAARRSGKQSMPGFLVCAVSSSSVGVFARPYSRILLRCMAPTLARTGERRRRQNGQKRGYCCIVNSAPTRVVRISLSRPREVLCRLRTRRPRHAHLLDLSPQRGRHGRTLRGHYYSVQQGK